MMAGRLCRIFRLPVVLYVIDGGHDRSSIASQDARHDACGAHITIREYGTVLYFMGFHVVACQPFTAASPPPVQACRDPLC